MTDINDTKPLPETTPKDAPPAGVEDEMASTLEERFEAFKALTEERFKTINATLAGFKSSDEIDASIDRAVQTHFGRIETLVNTAVTEFGSAAFVIERMDAVTLQLNQINEKMNIRTTSAAASDRNLDAVVKWINIMAARDVTDPDSKAIAEPYFDAIKRMATEANLLALAMTREFSEGRVDYAESMHTLNDGIATVNAVAAELKPLALSVARAQTLVDIGLRLAKRPRLAFGLFIGGLAAFGGGAVLTPEVIKLIGNTILSVFTGAN